MNIHPNCHKKDDCQVTVNVFRDIFTSTEESITIRQFLDCEALPLFSLILEAVNSSAAWYLSDYMRISWWTFVLLT